MKRNQLLDLLKKHNACPEATEWVRASDKQTAREIWESCERGDWMLWIAARLEIDRKLIVTAACLCARQSLVHVRPGEERPRIAIETAERWTHGEATINEVQIARNAAADDAAAACAAAYDADADAAAYAAAYAAYAAAYAADAAAYAAAYAADAAAYAYAADADADAAAYAADAAAYAAYAAAAAYAARRKSLAESARLVRTVITWDAIEAKIGGAR